MNITQLPIYTLTAVNVIILLGIIAYLFYSLYRYKLQAITAGLEDEKILKEYGKSQKKGAKAVDIISVVLSLILFAGFAVSIYSRTTENYFPIKGIGSIQLVGSGSMSYKNENNGYLFANNIDNQFNIYDLIIIKEKPPEKDLKLYDVVVYKGQDRLIVHRIIDIEKSGGATKYILRGDANSKDDPIAISYGQITGIYSNKRIPAAGIFVLFLQSALGHISMGLVFIAEFIAPYFEKKIKHAAEERLKIISENKAETMIKSR